MSERSPTSPPPTGTVAPTAMPTGLDRMRSVHARTRAEGHSALIVLHTPYGGGADALVKEWRRYLLEERETLFEGFARSDGTYRPLREVVSRYVRTLDDLGLLDDELNAALGLVASSLGLPTLGQMRPRPLDGGGVAQLQFFEALGSLLAMASRKLPGSVLVHDIHKADSTTRAALRYVIENVVTDPVARFAASPRRAGGFVGTFVVSTSEADGSVDALRDALSNRDNVHFISLRDAEEEQVRRFLASDDVVRRLMTASAGSVEHLAELIASLPARVEDLFIKRVERRTRAERSVLEALAVLGRPVKPDFLLRVADCGDDAPSLSALAEQRLIVRQASRGELVVDMPTVENREMLYATITKERRMMLHGRVAALFEERSRLGEPVDLETVAFHYLRSNVEDKAIRYALDAAERLHISFAYQRAREVLVELLPRLEDGHQTRPEVLERLAELEASLGEHTAALETFEDLLVVATENARPAVMRRIGEIYLEMGRYDEAMEAVGRARSAAEEGLDGHAFQLERLRIDTLAAEALYGLGEYDGALEVVQGATEHLKACDLVECVKQLIRLDNTRGKVHLFLGDYGEAQARFIANEARARQQGWPQEEVRALFNQGTIALQRRHYAQAESIFERCMAFGAEISNPVTRSFLKLNLGVIYHKTLRYGEALDAYLASLAMFKQSGNDLQFGVTAMNLGSLYEVIGDTDRARALLEAAIDTTRRRDIKYFLGRALFVLGTLELMVGDGAAALDVLRQAEGVLGKTGSTFADRIRIAMARASHLLGNETLRDRWMSEVDTREGSLDMREIIAEHNLYSGAFALAGADARRARPLLVSALAIYEQMEQQERVWLARLYLALALAACGDHDEALAMARSTADLVRSLAERVPQPLRATYLGERMRARVFDVLDALENGDTPTLERGVDVAAPSTRSGESYAKWRERYANIVGEDSRLVQIFSLVDRVSASDSTVLIQGESGTGKELIAEAIHTNSTRVGGAFVKVNCAAFVETLLLSELFGHERGAFTGAMARKKGRFELAHGGTLFLDEIGDISANTQVALLRVLQEGTFERVGGNETVTVDVRLICATNRNMEEMVRAGTFRLDLYYRLKGVVLELPALRERRADIPLLIEHFAQQFSRGGRSRRFSRDALAYLVRYSWPGNVRELENFVRSMLLFVDGDRIELANVRQFDDFFADGAFLDDVPAMLMQHIDDRDAVRRSTRVTRVEDVTNRQHASPSETPTSLADLARPEEAIASWALDTGVGITELRKRIEIELIRRALEQSDGNIAQAARLLDMKRPRLSQIVNNTPELVSVLGEIKDT